MKLRKWLDSKCIPYANDMEQEELTQLVKDRRAQREGSGGPSETAVLQGTAASQREMETHARSAKTSGGVESWSVPKMRKWLDRKCIPYANDMERDELIRLVRSRRAEREGVGIVDDGNMPIRSEIKSPRSNISAHVDSEGSSLPYGGDVQAAMQAQDRNAIRVILKTRERRERGQSEEASSAPSSRSVNGVPGVAVRYRDHDPRRTQRATDEGAHPAEMDGLGSVRTRSPSLRRAVDPGTGQTLFLRVHSRRVRHLPRYPLGTSVRSARPRQNAEERPCKRNESRGPRQASLQSKRRSTC